jgi:hypothetical protein
MWLILNPLQCVGALSCVDILRSVDFRHGEGPPAAIRSQTMVICLGVPRTETFQQWNEPRDCPSALTHLPDKLQCQLHLPRSRRRMAGLTDLRIGESASIIEDHVMIRRRIEIRVIENVKNLHSELHVERF